MVLLLPLYLWLAPPLIVLHLLFILLLLIVQYNIKNKHQNVTKPIFIDKYQHVFRYKNHCFFKAIAFAISTFCVRLSLLFVYYNPALFKVFRRTAFFGTRLPRMHVALCPATQEVSRLYLGKMAAHAARRGLQFLVKGILPTAPRSIKTLSRTAALTSSSKLLTSAYCHHRYLFLFE